MALPGLVIHLDCVQDWTRLPNDGAPHPFWTSTVVADPNILALVKTLQGAVVWLEQLFIDLSLNVGLN